MEESKEQQGRGQWKKDKADRGLSLHKGVYYIRYRENGKLRWKAVGPSKAFARKVLEKRRTEAREGKCFPDAVARRTTWEQIVDDALRATEKKHQLKFAGARPFADFRWRVIRPWFAGRLAASITAVEIDQKLNERAKTGATKNQYRL